MPYPHNHTCDCLKPWNDNTNITHLTIGDSNRYKVDNQKLMEKVEEQEAIIDTMRSANNSLSINMTTPNQSMSSMASSSISAPAFA